MKRKDSRKNRSFIAITSILLMLLLSLPMISYALPQFPEQNRTHEINRWSIRTATKHGLDFTIGTDLFTVKFAGSLQVPKFQFWYNSTEENRTVYQVFFHQIFEFNDTDGDGSYNATNDKVEQMFALPSANLSLSEPLYIRNQTTSEVVGARFNFTVSGRKGGGLPEASITLQCSLYNETQSGLVAGENKYNVTGGAELKIDVIINRWPFKDDDNLLCLRWSVNQQNATVEPAISDNSVTFGRGYFRWIDEATVDGEPVNVTGSFNMTGRTVNVYLAYPNFQNKSLIHDPSLGVAEVVALRVTGSLSKDKASAGETVTVSATVKDEDGNPVAGANVEVTVGSVTIDLSDRGGGNYEGTLDTSKLGEGPFNIVITAQKDGCSLNLDTLTLNIQQATPWVTYTLTGLIVTVASIIGAVILTRRR